jgi:hypothetical protein
MRAFLLSLATALVLGGTTNAFAQPNTQLTGSFVFSREFLNDRLAAATTAATTRSLEPVLALLTKYTKPEEVAELELTVALMYSQYASLIDYPKSVTHFTRALAFSLPEHVWVQVTLWRAGSLLIMERDPEAIKDALRVLVALSYRDMSQGCVPLENPTLPLQIPSVDPQGRRSASRPPPTSEEIQRRQDYSRYREHVERQRDLSTSKYHAVDHIQRIQARSGISDSAVRTALTEVTPDPSRPEIVFNWLKSPNPFPRCRGQSP